MKTDLFLQGVKKNELWPVQIIFLVLEFVIEVNIIEHFSISYILDD